MCRNSLIIIFHLLWLVAHGVFWPTSPSILHSSSYHFCIRPLGPACHFSALLTQTYVTRYINEVELRVESIRGRLMAISICFSIS
ncbi:uncharacterized protein BDW70DRAFT_483 [Aspergillus foveolatus]|uniref:uncharacterized protein n=1 Tax=Aspergillus foveolatus TaxID=210207 RepID=UPI003CCD75A8